MNTTDHPDLTAYALGELDAEHAEAMARWIAENPEAQAELEVLSDLGLHLQSTAPLAVASLHPHQREAVLNGPQRVRQLVAAAQQKRPRKSLLLPALHTLSRLAAAALLVVAGYLAGVHLGQAEADVEVVKTPVRTPPMTPKNTQPVTPFKAVEVPQVVMRSAADLKTETGALVSKPEVHEPKPTLTAVTMIPQLVAKLPNVKMAAPINRLHTTAFINAAREAQTEVVLRPVETRPVVAPAGPVAAALIKDGSKSPPLSAKTKTPELLIHSWKAEVASCPWDETRRLVRLVVQTPGEQPAAAPGYEYRLSVGFDPKYVRNFRALGGRSVPASAIDAPAFHIAWYEFIPNGPTTDVARVIGHVTLPNARFTTATTAPFDASSLQIVDRGTGWASTREDFLFETAVMGFGLLLKGEKDSGKLDHALVLDLAQRSGSEEGERVKFAKLVKDAQKATGL